MFSLYRKAFAALLVGALGVGANFVPGLGAVDPVIIQAIATVAAAAAVLLAPNKLDGYDVAKLGQIVVETLIRDGRYTETLRRVDEIAGGTVLAGAVRPTPGPPGPPAQANARKSRKPRAAPGGEPVSRAD
jgi:hypothetical protein